jgi:vacuolar iron transporter family protein
MKSPTFDPKLMRAAVYGANDGIITTFAVVSGVAGAGLSIGIIIILGLANMIADGVSMGMADFLGERSEQRMRRNSGQEYVKDGLWKTGLITFCAFVIAGALPLLPYFLWLAGVPLPMDRHFTLSIISTTFTLFFIGSLRTIYTRGTWWKNGAEMLGIGAVAAIIAYSLGAAVEPFVSGIISL